MNTTWQSGARARRSIRQRWLLVGLAALLSPGCASTDERKPTPEFLAVRPQRISVAEPYGGGDEIDLRVGLEFRYQLPRLGYEVAEPGTPADAELRYYVERTVVGSRWQDGRERATVELTAELRSPVGILWENEATAYGSENSDGDHRHDLLDVIVGVTADALEDSISEPDYSEEFDEAIRDAVYLVLLTLPERPAPSASGAPGPRGQN